ncbi:MAG: asparagine synthase-related protein [Candidatus Bathyarchaeia archaeon]
MGGFVAVVAKKGDNALQESVQAVQTLSHRGADYFGASSGGEVYTADSPSGLPTFEAIAGSAFRLQKILDSDLPQPLETEYGSLIFEGEAYDDESLISSHNINHFLEGKKPFKALTDIVRKYDGMYVSVLNDGRRLFVARDPQGLKPLYYGENPEVYALASDRKALWFLGITETLAFPPGSVSVITPYSKKDVRVREPELRQGRKVERADRAAKAVAALLIKAVRERSLDVNRVAVAFSGGVDSSILASIAKDLGIRVQLFTFGVEGFSDFSKAFEAAASLDLPISVIPKTLDEVEESLAEVAWLVEEPTLMNLEIAIPLYWTGDYASRKGEKVIFAGQGADELFGGYKRFQTLYQKYGWERAEEAIKDSLKGSPHLNYQRDEPIFSACKIRPRFPYTDLALTEYAAGIPLQLNLSDPFDSLRKRVLREAAFRLSLPRSIIESKKKAIQYETGSARALRIISKRHGLKPYRLVQMMFEKAKNTYLHPAK